MFPLIVVHILLIESGQLIFSVRATLVEEVSSGKWDGVGLYISVKRDVIQEKLSVFHCSVSSQCEACGPRLFIPRTPVLPDLQYMDHHPLYIDIGYMTSHDFDEYLDENPKPLVAVSGFEVTVTIPLLSGTPQGRPVYALSLAMLYEKSRGDFPKTNFLYPYIPVDEIRKDKNGATVRNGSEELRLSFTHPTYCKSPPSIVKEEFENFVLSDFQFGLPVPDFSFCDRHSFKSRFCTNAHRIKGIVNRYAPNICTKWTSNDIQHCSTTVEIQKITQGFRNLLLVGNDPIHILASERNRYNSSVTLKYPCEI